MKRRAFLQTSSVVSLPVLLNGLNITAVARSPLFNMIDENSDKVLVLINLFGGNDGLNTIIPLDQYDALANLRQNLVIPQGNLLPISDTNAMHPSFAGMKALYDNDQLAIVQNVGYPNQNRSHFRSNDIWTTGSESDEFLATGWMGRYFDQCINGFPEGFPNAQYPDPIAITIGYFVSETCQGQVANYSIAINDPESLAPLTEGIDSELPDNCYGRELTFVRNAIKQTNAYSDVVLAANENGSNVSSKYPVEGANPLADQLRIVAKLISGGLQTKIYVVSLGGFDTHANQIVPGNPLSGFHATLLEYVGNAVEAFQDDLKLQGLDDRVVGMTYSEFGRQIRSNFSFGTDHGTAAPLFVFGKCVHSDIIGNNTELSQNFEPQAGLPMQYDFRSVYGSILMDWFGAEEDAIKDVFFDGFQYMPIIKGCNATSTIDPDDVFGDFEALIYPNPTHGAATLSLETETGRVRVSIFNTLGAELKVVFDKTLNAGKHDVPIDLHDLVPGNYYVRILAGRKQKTKLIQRF